MLDVISLDLFRDLRSSQYVRARWMSLFIYPIKVPINYFGLEVVYSVSYIRIAAGRTRERSIVSHILQPDVMRTER